MPKSEISSLEVELLLESIITTFAHLYTGPNFHIRESTCACGNISTEVFIKFFNSTLLSTEVTQLSMYNNLLSFCATDFCSKGTLDK